MKLLQDYLRVSGLADLQKFYAIKANRHAKYPHLVQLKYSQIDSPMGMPIVQLCRGVILDESKDWEVVAFPYSKFFNHGEGHAAPIDWSTARVYEKEDGSLMTLYWYDGQWHVASSGLPDAAGDVNGGTGTFKDLFWDTWGGHRCLTERCLTTRTSFSRTMTTPTRKLSRWRTRSCSGGTTATTGTCLRARPSSCSSGCVTLQPRKREWPSTTRTVRTSTSHCRMMRRSFCTWPSSSSRRRGYDVNL